MTKHDELWTALEEYVAACGTGNPPTQVLAVGNLATAAYIHLPHLREELERLDAGWKKANTRVLETALEWMTLERENEALMNVATIAREEFHQESYNEGYKDGTADVEAAL